jgi:outer membrane receptor protein involved in Fe transport
VIAHVRRQRLLSSLLQPSEAFLVGEPPSLALGGRTANFELDYEYRFTARRFAKLFLFLSDADEYFVTPAVRQTPELQGFIIPEARSEGIGARYEQQVGRFLSAFLRYTYREVTDETPGASTSGRQLPMTPRSRMLLGLNYLDRAGNKLYLEGDWQSALFADRFWRGDTAFDPNATRPRVSPRFLVNLRLGQERSVRGEWVLRVNNLFNTGTIYWPGFPAPGRTYELQYRARF